VRLAPAIVDHLIKARLNGPWRSTEYLAKWIVMFGHTLCLN